MNDHHLFDFPTSEDIPVLSFMWQTCFGETQEDALFFLKNRFRPGETIILRNGAGMPVSMMTLIPARLNNVAGAYLYGVATHPDYRGQGLMHLLHREAIQYLASQGTRFTCLVPATHSLFSLYAELGYEVRFYRARREYYNLTPCPFIDLHIPSMVDFTAMRSEYLQRLPYRLRLLCPDYLYQELRHYGGDAVSFACPNDKTGYAAYTLSGSTLYLRECNVDFTPELGASLLAYTGCRQITVELPEPGYPIGMYRPLGKDPFPDDFTAYLSLCLDT